MPWINTYVFINFDDDSSLNKCLNPKNANTVDIAEQKLKNGEVIVDIPEPIIVSSQTMFAIITGIFVIVTVEIMHVNGFLFLLSINTIIEYTKIPIAGASISFKTVNILLNTLVNP